MRKLVARLTPPMLAVRLPRGWTVAVSLAHMAFWDRQRMLMMRRLAAGEELQSHYDGELFNDVLLPFLEMMPPQKTGPVAIQMAEEVDALLLQLPDKIIEAAMALPNPPRIDRGSHREYHLERMEKAMADAGY